MLVTELELPTINTLDEELRGPVYQETMAAEVTTIKPDGEPAFGTPSGIYGLDRLPLVFER